MSLIERLYAEQDERYLEKVWNKFIFLSPNFSYLRMDFVKRSLSERDMRFPLAAFRFVLFSDESDIEVNENMRRCINRGIKAINILTNKYIEGSNIFKLEEISKPLNLFEFINNAYENWERGTKGVRRINPELRALAYASTRALELGYRVGTIDASPEVQNSIINFDQNIDRLEQLIGFRNPEECESSWPNGPTTKWNTNVSVKVYSKDKFKPMPARLKYLEDNHPKYSSILMKIYSGMEYPSEIRDYTGVEFVVEDDISRDELVNYFRRETSPGLTFEGFKDTTNGSKLTTTSSSNFGVKKFFLRVPGKLSLPLEHDAGKIVYGRNPVEIQILTLEDARKRDSIPEISHFEYKRRQFMKIFPALFPKKIYEQLIRNI